MVRNGRHGRRLFLPEYARHVDFFVIQGYGSGSGASTLKSDLLTVNRSSMKRRPSSSTSTESSPLAYIVGR